MEQVGTQQEVIADAKAKEVRVRAFLEREDLDALVLGRQDNFAWMTVGGDNRVVTTSEMGFAYLVITRDRKWLVAHTMDGERSIEEQAPGQGYELVTLRWYEGSPESKVAELTRGMKVGADFLLPAARLLGPEIVDLHYPLTDLELRRCRWVGQTSNAILARVAADLQPGMSEREIAARLLYEYALAEMTIDVLIVGADERIARFRHPLPTGNRLRRYALLHPAARRWGLHANVTRLVHFGQPPEELRRAASAAQTIAANAATMLRPGVRFADILVEQKRLYASLGYTEEWRNHFQGGITGYTLADAGRSLQPEAKAVSGQAYDYFVTITGAKAEELFLLTAAGVEVHSAGPGWPLRQVETARGAIAYPDVLIRD